MRRRMASVVLFLCCAGAAYAWEDASVSEESKQYLPLTREEYDSLERELAPLSKCVHEDQTASARFTGQVNGRKIAKKIVAAGRGADVLRDAGALPNYLQPEAAIPSGDRGELVDQVSTALWGIPYYVASDDLVASRKPEAALTLTQKLRARAIFAYYGAIATKNCKPSDTFNGLFEKANAR